MLFKIAWRDLARKPFQNILSILIGALAIGLAIAVMLIGASLKQGLTDAAMPFDMLVASPGSPMQVVLNTIFLQDTPLPNLDKGIWPSLARDERITHIIPFGYGDNYQGFRVVGTNTEIFELRPALTAAPIFQLKEGEFFKDSYDYQNIGEVLASFTENSQEHLSEKQGVNTDVLQTAKEPTAQTYEAVIGAQVALHTALKLGDVFKTTHGFVHLPSQMDEHEHEFVVVGILEPMNLPYDQGIFIDINAVWEMHAGTEGDVTALMLSHNNLGSMYEMYQELNDDPLSQAVLPGDIMGEIFSLMGDSEQILRAITYLVLGMALIQLAITLNWSALNRKRDNSILRVMGASRRDILSIVLIQGLVIAVSAAVLGFIFAHLLAGGVSLYIQNTTAIYSQVSIVAAEFILMVVAIIFSLLMSLIPALRSYQQDVVAGLGES